MKFISKSLQIGLVGVSLAIAGITCAQAGSHQSSMHDDNTQMQQGSEQASDTQMSRLTQKLNLTPKQQQTISQKLTSIGEKMQDAVSQIQSARSKLQALRLQGDFTNSNINDLAQQQGDALTQLILLRMQSNQAVFSALTPKQQKMYLRMIKKRHDKIVKMMQS